MEEKKLTGYASIDKPWLKYYSENAIDSPLPAQTLYEHILTRNQDNMSSYALNYFGVRITYKKLFSRIDAVANAFLAWGVKKGDIVSLCMPTTPETIYTIYALNKIGAIANMIELSTNTSNILKRINSTNSKYLVMLDSMEEKINQIIDESTLERVISVAPTNSLPAIVNFMIRLKSGKHGSKNRQKKYIDWKEFIKYATKATAKPVIYTKASPALIVYTGGTTGLPKGAVLSNDGINATIAQLKYTGINSEVGDKYLDIMPPFIAYGVVCGIHNPLSEQQEIIIIPKLEPQKFASYIRKYKPNHVIGVPALFETMVKSEELKTEDLSFLQNMICGGDKLTTASETQINNFLADHNSKARVAQGFGMTEVGTSVTYTLDNKKEPKPNHIGYPLVASIIKIVKPGTEEELSYNEVGEICICTPSRMLGYYQNEEETSSVLRNHSDGKVWIHSKDIGYMNQDGELFFIDRIKRMIVRHDGHNVWPGAIEQIISSHHAVDTCVVVGITKEENTNGATPTAFIVIKDEYKSSEQEILAQIDKLCKKALPERDCAQEYYVRDYLPKTSVGKVDYRALEKEE